MPIHDQSYRHYGGVRETPRHAWLVIARTGIAALVRRRAFVIVLLAAWVPFVWRAAQVYATTYFPQARFLAVTAETFRQFLDQQAPFFFFVTLYAGSGLIANDRKANALQIYLARPLTRVEYIAGKMATLACFLLLVTWVPALLLLLIQVLLTGSLGFLREHLFLVPAITLFAFVQTCAASFSMLALSSLSTSSRYVAVLYAGFVLVTRAMFETLRGLSGTSTVSWLSFTASLQQIGDLLFRQRLRYDTPAAVSFLVILGLVLVSASVLERRVRGVEVVT